MCAAFGWGHHQGQFVPICRRGAEGELREAISNEGVGNEHRYSGVSYADNASRVMKNAEE